MTPENAEWARRVARPWRVVFAIYTAALVTGTHWPALVLPDAAVTDKQIHLFAFGGLTVLLWCTRWLPAGGWLVGLAAALFGALDEFTQGIPGLHRQVSIADVMVNELGVVMALAWIWALRPVGGPPNRLRLAYGRFVLSELALRPAAWVAVGLGAGLGVPAIVVGGWLLPQQLGLDPQTGQRVWVFCITLGALGCASLAVTGIRRHREATRRADQPCFACGSSCRGGAYDEGGWGRCPACEAPVHRGQWTQPPGLRPSAVVRAIGPALSAGIIRFGVVVVAFLIGVVVLVPEHVTPNTAFALILGGVGLIGALAVRVYRSARAQLHDQQGVRCRRCSHDLHATPAEQGIGHCPQCKAPFARR